MQLEFSADQDELRDSIRAVLSRERPVALVRRMVDEGVRPGALWTTLSGLGWPALTVAESDGGIGLGMIEAGILAEEIIGVTVSTRHGEQLIDTVAEIERVAAGGFRAILLPAIPPIHYYSRELENKLKKLTTLFEPAVILVMGLVVGFVAIALVQAMYGIYAAPSVTGLK